MKGMIWYGNVMGVRGKRRRTTQKQGRLEGLCEVTRWCEKKVLQHGMVLVIGIGIKGEWKRGEKQRQVNG